MAKANQFILLAMITLVLAVSVQATGGNLFYLAGISLHSVKKKLPSMPTVVFDSMDGHS
ncbi:hypothetical protein [Pedobacter sp. ASV12]|uniref:hypothetical protein n=1 Tax=Pedobacter sp. ASV12 TaxID=2795120 RepID=UPI0018ECA7F7|nr:hypothetical protein [Pedobacter sp. ASV12]